MDSTLFKMAPSVPEEVDVFTIPHSRMKELVSEYVALIQRTNFARLNEMERLLQSLCRTFAEFKTHELIENKLIMKKLKTKLKELSITCTAVCNCHKDNKLTEMLTFIRGGFSKKTVQDRVNFGTRLKDALEEFTATFLPHMEEEEEVFGPMLMQYFTYDELQRLKAKVVEQHLVLKQLKEWGDLQEVAKGFVTSSSSDSEDERARRAVATTTVLPRVVAATSSTSSESQSFDDLPLEVQLQVFGYLSPRDLGRCAQVSRGWSALAWQPQLWRSVRPVLWSKGKWLFHMADDAEGTDGDSGADAVSEEMKVSGGSSEIADDANDELSEAGETRLISELKCETRVLRGLTQYVLPRVGVAVETLDLANSRALTNPLLNRFLKLCPNVCRLNLAHTRVSEGGLVGLGIGTACKLQSLTLAGCVNVSDALLVRLAMALSGNAKRLQNVNTAIGDCCLCEQFYKACHQKLGTACDAWLGKGGCCAGQDATGCGDGQNSSRDVPSASPPLQAPRQSASCRSTKKSDSAADCCGNEKKTVPGCTDAGNASIDCSQGDIEMVRVADIESIIVAAAEDMDARFVGQGQGQRKVGSSVSDAALGARTPPSRRGSNGSSAKAAGSSSDTGEDVEKGDAEKEDTVTRRRPRRNVGGGGGSKMQDVFAEKKMAAVTADYLQRKPSLQRLDLSGCFQVTDVGLRALVSSGQLSELTTANLSGCWRLKGTSLVHLSQAAPRLVGREGVLYYCDNITGGPTGAGVAGCQNLQCTSRYCCRSGR